MDQENQRILETFETNFAGFKQKNIVLYGVGAKTKLILDTFPDYNIIGLLDRIVTGGTVSDTRILSIELILDLKVDVMIVAAKECNVEAVYRRICHVCHANGILLYDVYGRDLFEVFDLAGDMKYFRVRRKNLEEQIRMHEVITFDIFDTLVMRKTLYPSDVFAIMEARLADSGPGIPGFAEMRTRADLDIAYRNPNLYDIYDNLQKNTGLTDEQKNSLIALELQIEKDVLIRREAMVEMLEYAVKYGKTVCLVSDMYLPGHAVESLLKNLGIRGYQEIFVSCDYKKVKTNGLFECVMKKYPVASYLHIGDNSESDGFIAKLDGADVFLIRNARDMLSSSTYSELASCVKTLNDRSLLGLAIARLFNDPFCLHGTEEKPVFKQIYDYGYFFAGPLLTAFVMWFIQEIRAEKFDGILFSARDGFLMQRLYDRAIEIFELTGMPSGIYFQTSRMLCAKAALDNNEDILWMTGPAFSCTPEEMMKDRFELNDEDILPHNSGKYESTADYAIAHKEKISVKSEEIRRLYLQYMEDVGLKPGEKYALFDFVSCGSCQYFLDKIVPFELNGLYVGKYDSGEEKKNQMKLKAMFNNSFLVVKQSNFILHYLFFETMMTSFSPSIAGIDKKGEFIYNSENRTTEEFDYVKEMHRAVTDYFNGFAGCLAVGDSFSDTTLVDKMIGRIAPYFTDNRCEFMKNLYLTDDFGHGKIELRTSGWLEE